MPDDASGLERDREAWLREQVAARRRARWRRVFLTRRWETHGISGPIVAAALAVVPVAALALALLVPQGRAERPVARPLATPGPQPGMPGGLLPDLVLGGAGKAPTPRASRALRPGVVALVPDVCPDCRRTLIAVERTARDRGLSTWLVGTDGDRLAALAAEPDDGGGYSVPLVDATGVLATAYDLEGPAPTLLLVDATGVVRDVVERATATTPILGRLDVVVEPPS